MVNKRLFEQVTIDSDEPDDVAAELVLNLQLVVAVDLNLLVELSGGTVRLGVLTDEGLLIGFLINNNN